VIGIKYKRQQIAACEIQLTGRENEGMKNDIPSN
jgi:hypothetical protein